MSINSRFNRQLIENREVRIFLSSTFSDMDAERSALVKTFNTLKIEAYRRNVTLSVLDLRWGVTEEESRTGKVLSVCLNEIEHSHPFFIGLLGSRYGYAPNINEIEKNPDLEERYPWIRGYIEEGMSITEMEMQYGVLRNQKDVDAVFYIKNTPEIKPDDNNKLVTLKKKIREQKHFPVDDYTSIEDLCAKVEKAVTDMMDKYFPKEDTTRLGRERVAQKAYMNSRHGHYVKKQEDYDRLDHFLTNEETHLVVTGPSGMGKSALIANWLKEKERQGENFPYKFIYHFVGNSFGDNSHEEILQHITDEIYDLYGLERREDNKEKREEEAQRILIEAGQKGKPLLIVIDGINQIAERNNSKLLNWLPQSPHKVKYLFSTLEDDETMQTFRRRGYPIHTIKPLNDEHRQMFITNYLANVGKKLSDKQLSRILHDPENENTLVLKTLLDELICFGSYEKLDERIHFYLSATSISDFFDRVLQRMEEDYLGVARILSLIAVSERGLSEDEILAITKMRPMDWHLFYCAFYNHLVTRDGLISFAHQYITNAVWSRYRLKDISAARFYREEIIQYFQLNNKANKNRHISELAFQYYSCDDNENLYKTVLSFDSFNHFRTTDKGEKTIAIYWSHLINNDAKRYRLESYLDLPNNGWMNTIDILTIGQFAQSYFTDYETAIKCFKEYQKFWESGTGSAVGFFLADFYYNMGAIFREQRKYTDALDYFFKALTLQEKSNRNKLDIADSYNSIGVLYDDQGNHSKALEFYFKALQIFEKEKNRRALLGSATSYNNIGCLYGGIKNYPKALEYHYKALTLCKDLLGEKDEKIALYYNNIGYLYNDQGNYPKALEFHLKAIVIYENILGFFSHKTADTYNNLGQTYFYIKDYRKAYDCYSKVLTIMEGLKGKGHPVLAAPYYNVGFIYSKLGNYHSALAYFVKSLAIYEKSVGPDHPNTKEVKDSIKRIEKIIQEKESESSLSKSNHGQEVENVRQMPVFPGGNAALSNYISSNVHYPESAKKERIQGQVKVSFVVDSDGSITDVAIVNSVDPLLDQEALRVVRNMPHWQPGIINGQTVRFKFTIPISFKLD
jgi:preprotein translocase subunit SecA/nephrocystin-3